MAARARGGHIHDQTVENLTDGGGLTSLLRRRVVNNSAHRSALMATEDDSSALAVLVDCGPSWREPAALGSALEQLLIFLNAYQLLSATNQLTVLASHSAAVDVLWPPPDAGADVVMATSDAHGLRAAVTDGVARIMATSSAASGDDPSDAAGTDEDAPLLSAALTAALCRLHRATRAHPRVQPRILILHASADAPTQHLAMMNGVFAAQKLGVLIDAVLLNAAADSMVLQQSAFLTGGLYLRAPRDAPVQRALVQYLITCCLPDRYARQFLSAPPQGQLETRALCFLSKQPLEIGFACSVCLAVFSHDKIASCPVCSTRFSLAQMLPGQLLGKKKLKKAPAAAPAAPFGGAAGGAAGGAVGGAGTPAAITLPPAPPGELAPWQVENRRE